MCRFETAIQRYCPTCCLPYLDTRLDCPLPRPSDSAIFTPQHFGDNRGPVRDGFAANWRPEPLDCDIYRNGVLTRWSDRDPCSRGVVYTDGMIQDVLRRQSYDHLCQPYTRCRFENDHARVHMMLGGHMGSLPCSTVEPLFFNHHCFVDMQVEMVRGRLPASRWIYPQRGTPWRHAARDQMSPFDFRNEDGLDDETIGKEYVYEESPFDVTCSTHEECSPTGLLWCNNGACEATCRQGGVCRDGLHASCFCPTGTPQCTNRQCQCT